MPVDESVPQARVVVVSGLSGSGKSTAIRALEDLGYFCIDNLPIVLLPKLIELFPSSPDEIERIALVIDARKREFLAPFKEYWDRIREDGTRADVVFLECSDKVLLRRYQETRRRHPLGQGMSIEEGIAEERSLLQDLKDAADVVFDTSEYNPHQLRQVIQDHFTQVQPGREMNLCLMSFGFKNGIPSQANLVFDARFLNNPYFVPELRDLDGTDSRVSDFVLEQAEAKEFVNQIDNFLTTFRPLYDREGKSCLTVGVGCTGGRHRSVAVVEQLARRLQARSESHMLRHRDKA